MHILLALILSILVSCSSTEQEIPKKTVAIFTYRVENSQPWDPGSIKNGITGSEEAVIYMSQKLADLGYQVTVFADPPKGSPHSAPEANPRFVQISYIEDGKMYDYGVSWRVPFNGENLKKRAKKVYLWPHDTYHWPLTETMINSYDDVFWVSEWQRQQWMSTNPGFVKFTNIFGNGLNPDQFNPVTERENPHSCIWASNYARGLWNMLNIWPEIKTRFPKATLDIYYGWNHWGLLTPEHEAEMRRQVEELAVLDVREHGLVGHDEINRAFERTSLWTYPTTYPEVFAITAIRAQFAGTIPVVIPQAAMKVTVRHGFTCETVEEYLDTLTKAMQSAEKTTVAERAEMRDFILKEYTWEIIAARWQEIFKK